MKSRQLSSRRLIVIAANLAACAAAHGADVNWTNGSSNFVWDTSSLNWSTGAWNNTNADGAIFGATGAGAVSVPGAVVVDSINFTDNGYVLNGAGPINFATGVSTESTGVVTVGTGSLARINVPINSDVGFQKIGGGVLEIAGAGNYTGAIPITANGILRADVLIGSTSGTINGGTLRVLDSAALPASTRVSIGTGYLDLGGEKVKIAQLNFTNQNPNATWNSTLNANNGVIGSGTLEVDGDINVIGVTGLAGGNAIASNVDLGGGEQVVRCGVISLIGLHTSLMFTGPIHNGSLVKTVGVTAAGTFGSVDGIGLYANNTYTGETVLNSGSSIAAGVNQSGSIKVHGLPAGPAGSSFTLLGANGSFPMATTIQASAGASFILDNNGSLGATGLIQPTVPQAQNNDRLNDNAAITLRDGNFTYRGLAATAASETFGSLNASGGQNVVTMQPNGGGSVTLTAGGNLTVGPRATLFVNTLGTGNTLGGNSRFFVNGTLPAADATGILQRVTNSADFVTYNASTGLTPFTGYSTDFTTANTNVAIAAAATAPTQTINALKRSGTFAITIGATDTLSITSGMILNATGTGTYTGGGTIAFGNTPGVLLGGTNFIGTALSGTDGLIMSSGTGTLAGNMSGLTGELSVHAATANMNTNTFGGPIRVRSGTLNLNVSQTGAGLGAITLGVPENDVDLIGTVPTLNFSGAGANAVFDRDLIIDNGAETAKGMTLSFSTITRLSPLANNSGSQTFTGNVELRSSVNLQGGAGTGTVTGATVFTGDVTGAGRFVIPNGRVLFTSTSDISNAGGFWLGNPGFTYKVTFGGKASGNGQIRLSSGNNNTISYVDGGMPLGPITVLPNGGSGVPTIIPLENSTIQNVINMDGDAFVDVGAGINATWNGALQGKESVNKIGAGRLTISGNSNSHSGLINVDIGELHVDGDLPSSVISVDAGALLGGNGTVGTHVNSNGAISPGSSIGTLTIGGVTLSGSLRSEIDLTNGGPAAADLLQVNGAVNLSTATLDLSVFNIPSFSSGTYVIVGNDLIDAVSGTFAVVNGVPAGGTFNIDYAFSGVDSIGRIGDGNDIAITVTVPEPATAALLLPLAMMFRRRR